MYFQAILNLYWKKLEIMDYKAPSHKRFIALQYVIPLFQKCRFKIEFKAKIDFFSNQLNPYIERDRIIFPLVRENTFVTENRDDAKF